MEINEDSLKCLNPIVSDDVIKAKEAVIEVLNNRDVLQICFMSNFGWDRDAELFYGYPIVRGLVVTVVNSFVCNMNDKLWFHPLMNKVRSSYTDNNNNTDLGEYADVVGTYIDGSGSLSYDGSVMNMFISDMTAPENNRDAILKGVAKLSDGIKPISNLNRYNDIRTDGRNIHIFNHVCRVGAGNSILIALHPIRGYVEVVASCDTNIPVDFGHAQRIKWENVQQSYTSTLYSRCAWESPIPYNIHTMRGMNTLSPKDTAKWCALHNCYIAQHWNTKKAIFSVNDVRYNLTLRQAMELTPPQHFLPSIPSLTKEERIPIALKQTHLIIDHLTRIQAKFPEFQLFCPEILGDNENFLYLPRNLISECLEEDENV